MIGRYDYLFGWYVVEEDRRPRLGDRVIVDGFEREVVVPAELPEEQASAILVLPDFNQPGCEGCEELPEPPTADWCRSRCGRTNPGPPRPSDRIM